PEQAEAPANRAREHEVGPKPVRQRRDLPLEELRPVVGAGKEPPRGHPPPQAGVRVGLNAVRAVDDRDAPATQLRDPFRIEPEGAPDVGEHDEVELALARAVQTAVAVERDVIEQAVEREAAPVERATP